MTLLESVNKFIDNISITDYQEDNVSGSFSNLKNHLTSTDCKLGIKKVFLNGSYLRKTIIRPLDDIDVFAEFDEQEYCNMYEEPNPQNVLNRFKSFLESQDDYKGKCHQSKPSITINLSDKHIDVLPTKISYGQIYIPNEDLTGWIITDPENHTENLNKANKDRNYLLKKVVKAVKSWKKNNEVKIASFHVEEIGISISNWYDYKNVKEGIELWFKNAEIFLKSDRCGTTNQYNATKDSISKAKKKIEDAIEKANNGKEDEAKTVWKELFGRDFPIYDAEEARFFSKALSEGSLKYSAAAGLSTTVGNAIAASRGFYGDDTKK